MCFRKYLIVQNNLFRIFSQTDTSLFNFSSKIMSLNTENNSKRNISRCLFGKADANAIFALEKQVVEQNKRNFIKRWGIDVGKLNKLTRINKLVECSSTSIGEMNEGDFLVVQS